LDSLTYYCKRKLTSFGIKPIHGNIEADWLAKVAQNQAAVLDPSNNICIIIFLSLFSALNAMLPYFDTVFRSQSHGLVFLTLFSALKALLSYFDAIFRSQSDGLVFLTLFSALKALLSYFDTIFRSQSDGLVF